MSWHSRNGFAELEESLDERTADRQRREDLVAKVLFVICVITLIIGAGMGGIR